LIDEVTEEGLYKAFKTQVKALEKGGAGANIIGGCCGTTPDHIKAIKEAVLWQQKPR
jgi:methionine synthase I (cobalamin-dependent)